MWWILPILMVSTYSVCHAATATMLGVSGLSSGGGFGGSLNGLTFSLYPQVKGRNYSVVTGRGATIEVEHLDIRTMNGVMTISPKSIELERGDSIYSLKFVHNRLEFTKNDQMIGQYIFDDKAEEKAHFNFKGLGSFHDVLYEHKKTFLTMSNICKSDRLLLRNEEKVIIKCENDMNNQHFTATQQMEYFSKVLMNFVQEYLKNDNANKENSKLERDKLLKEVANSIDGKVQRILETSSQNQDLIATMQRQQSQFIDITASISRVEQTLSSTMANNFTYFERNFDILNANFANQLNATVSSMATNWTIGQNVLYNNITKFVESRVDEYHTMTFPKLLTEMENIEKTINTTITQSIDNTKLQIDLLNKSYIQIAAVIKNDSEFTNSALHVINTHMAALNESLLSVVNQDLKQVNASLIALDKNFTDKLSNSIAEMSNQSHIELQKLNSSVIHLTNQSQTLYENKLQDVLRSFESMFHDLGNATADELLSMNSSITQQLKSQRNESRFWQEKLQQELILQESLTSLLFNESQRALSEVNSSLRIALAEDIQTLVKYIEDSDLTLAQNFSTAIANANSIFAKYLHSLNSTSAAIEQRVSNISNALIPQAIEDFNQSLQSQLVLRHQQLGDRIDLQTNALQSSVLEALHAVNLSLTHDIAALHAALNATAEEYQQQLAAESLLIFESFITLNTTVREELAKNQLSTTQQMNALENSIAGHVSDWRDRLQSAEQRMKTSINETEVAMMNFTRALTSNTSDALTSAWKQSMQELLSITHNQSIKLENQLRSLAKETHENNTLLYEMTSEGLESFKSEAIENFNSFNVSFARDIRQLNDSILSAASNSSQEFSALQLRLQRLNDSLTTQVEQHRFAAEKNLSQLHENLLATLQNTSADLRAELFRSSSDLSEMIRTTNSSLLMVLNHQQQLANDHFAEITESFERFETNYSQRLHAIDLRSDERIQALAYQTRENITSSQLRADERMHALHTELSALNESLIVAVARSEQRETDLRRDLARQQKEISEEVADERSRQHIAQENHARAVNESLQQSKVQIEKELARVENSLVEKIHAQQLATALLEVSQRQQAQQQSEWKGDLDAFELILMNVSVALSEQSQVRALQTAEIHKELHRQSNETSALREEVKSAASQLHQLEISHASSQERILAQNDAIRRVEDTIKSQISSQIQQLAAKIDEQVLPAIAAATDRCHTKIDGEILSLRNAHQEKIDVLHEKVQVLQSQEIVVNSQLRGIEEKVNTQKSEASQQLATLQSNLQQTNQQLQEKLHQQEKEILKLQEQNAHMRSELQLLLSNHMQLMNTLTSRNKNEVEVEKTIQERVSCELDKLKIQELEKLQRDQQQEMQQMKLQLLFLTGNKQT